MSLIKKLFSKDPSISELYSECHKAPMWYYDHLKTLVCGKVGATGHCCEKYQSKVYYKGELVSLSKIKVREYPGITLTPKSGGIY